MKDNMNFKIKVYSFTQTTTLPTEKFHPVKYLSMKIKKCTKIFSKLNNKSKEFFKKMTKKRAKNKPNTNEN